MIRKWIILSAIGLILTSSAVLAGQKGFPGRHPEERGPGGPHGGDAFGLGFLRTLNLTDAQKTQIAAILKTYQADIVKLAEGIHTGRKKMRDLLHAETFDAEAIRAAFQEVAKIEEELVVLRGTIISKVRPILTEEQLQIIEARRTLHENRLKGKMDEKLTELIAWLEGTQS